VGCLLCLLCGAIFVIIIGLTELIGLVFLQHVSDAENRSHYSFANPVRFCLSGLFLFQLLSILSAWGATKLLLRHLSSTRRGPAVVTNATAVLRALLYSRYGLTN